MEKISGFITNLGKYNKGELIGKWIKFPIDENELQDVLKEIGCYYVDENGIEHNAEYEEYFFTDWNCEMACSEFGEYPSIDAVNELASRLNALNDDEQEYIKLIMDGHTSDINTALEIVETNSYIIWNDCFSMSDVASNYVEETGMLQNVPSTIANYFDYEALGRDMDIEGTFLEGDGYYLEIIS